MTSSKQIVSLASVAKVGDYVNYGDLIKEDKSYTILPEDSGWDKQKMSRIHMNWQVLKNDGDSVTLISEKAMYNYNFTVKGKRIYIDTPKILDTVCNKLYSSEIGVSRNLKVEDIFEIWGYKPTEALYFPPRRHHRGFDDSVEYGTKISEIETRRDCRIDEEIYGRYTPDNRELGEYKLTMPSHCFISDYYKNEQNEKACELIFEYNNKYLDGEYHLSSTCVYANFDSHYVHFNIYAVHNNELTTTTLTDSMYSNEDPLYTPGDYTVSTIRPRPIVILKSSVMVENNVESGIDADNPWIIK